MGLVTECVCVLCLCWLACYKCWSWLAGTGARALLPCVRTEGKGEAQKHRSTEAEAQKLEGGVRKTMRG